ncbi:GNAT family N-acetyltransferase [Pseudoalteromonas sp. MMG005]|uniref:GNAT family N-acetyltransferase n=1 Tax=Pseudoalteromonas sp. MMG005 TaxID=2822682 RepID=UPI001B3A503E|nr:GNAT family N-acetyltransferase [Pseudoalteromonas sp. MMG005]MBQ4846035.1 GNAT family N-acetyltransferase [Pseudoalteromonas sp. MMG005]
MDIREASLKDLSNIARLHAQSWRETYGDVLRADYLNQQVLVERTAVWTKRLMKPSPNQYVLIAEDNTGFCGFICVYGGKHLKYGSIIDNLHVAKNCKGKGLGTKLLIAAASWAFVNYKNDGLYLEVLACNEQAIRFYKYHGGQNIDYGYWHTPCGNKVKEFIYGWESPSALANLS